MERIEILIAAQDAASKKIQDIAKKLEHVTKSVGNMGVDKKFVDSFNAANMELKETSQLVSDVVRQRSSFLRVLNPPVAPIAAFNGEMLNLLFFGMQLQQIFMSATKTIFEGYKKIIPESHAFNVMTTRLSANWEFFKFQLADALATSPLFKKLIDGAIGLLKALQELPEPMKEFLGWAAVGATIFAALMFYIGSFGLGMAGIINMAPKFSGALTMASKGGFLPWLSKIAFWTLIVMAAISLLKDAFSENADATDKSTNSGKQLRKVWGNLVDSILGPFLDKMGMSTNSINWMSVAWNGLKDVLAIVGMGFAGIIELIVFIGRTIKNVIDVAFLPFINTIKTTSDALSKLATGDFRGAFNTLKGFKLFDGWRDQLDDVVDAAKNLVRGMKDIGMGVTDIMTTGNAAIGNNINSAITDTSQSAGQKTVVVMSPQEAAAAGEIDTEVWAAMKADGRYGMTKTFDDFVQGGGY